MSPHMYIYIYICNYIHVMVHVYNTYVIQDRRMYILYIYIYVLLISLSIYIYMYIHTYVHENRSIPVLSIPFQRVFVITCVRTLVHIFNRRQDPQISRIHAINFEIQLDSNRAGSYFTRVGFPKIHAQ